MEDKVDLKQVEEEKKKQLELSTLAKIHAECKELLSKGLSKDAIIERLKKKYPGYEKQIKAEVNNSIYIEKSDLTFPRDEALEIVKDLANSIKEILKEGRPLPQEIKDKALQLISQDFEKLKNYELKNTLLELKSIIKVANRSKFRDITEDDFFDFLIFKKPFKAFYNKKIDVMEIECTLNGEKIRLDFTTNSNKTNFELLKDFLIKYYYILKPTKNFNLDVFFMQMRNYAEENEKIISPELDAFLSSILNQVRMKGAIGDYEIDENGDVQLPANVVRNIIYESLNTKNDKKVAKVKKLIEKMGFGEYKRMHDKRVWVIHVKKIEEFFKS